VALKDKLASQAWDRPYTGQHDSCQQQRQLLGSPRGVIEESGSHHEHPAHERGVAEPFFV
jgi:hypothetical protein